MNAEIISVGSELLLGQIVNSNAAFLSKELATIGVNVFYQTSVGDNKERLTDVVHQAFERSDLLIFTGGLGPTKDDLTKETVATIIGEKLIYDEPSLHFIEEYFRKRNKVMSENNKKQALVIEGSRVLPNHFGMAPGMLVTFGSKTIALLPGPPKEMEPMSRHELLPLLSKVGDQTSIKSRVLRFFGIGESQLETEIIDLIELQTNPTIAPLAGDGEVTLRITAKHWNKTEQLRLLDETEKQIQARVGQYFYGYDETTLFEQVFLQLEEKGCTISSAESFTGGLFSHQLSLFPGASTVFSGAIVSYSSELKQKVLGVSKETIDQFGVISHQCAKEMASCVKAQCGTSLGISFTGVAGPTQQENQPVGDIYIGIAGIRHEPISFKLSLPGNRKAITERAVKYGCFYLLNELKRWNKTE